MFEVNGEYANRKGKYTVLAIDGPIMSVRYEDGTHADLKINIQQRIWENIVAEQELASSKSAARKSSSRVWNNVHDPAFHQSSEYSARRRVNISWMGRACSHGQ